MTSTESTTQITVSFYKKFVYLKLLKKYFDLLHTLILHDTFILILFNLKAFFFEQILI